jgi:hypothetical protein
VAGLLCNPNVSNFTPFSDYSAGFGGKFGVQSDRVDKSAVGWEHVEKVEKHESQKGSKKCAGRQKRP